MFARIKDFDLYRKIPKDLTESTTHGTSLLYNTNTKTHFTFTIPNLLGTVLSFCASIFMLILFVAELWAFLSMQCVTNIVIDPNPDSLLRINFNITVVDLPCEFAVIDVVDVLGTRENNVSKNINKWQVDSVGLRRVYEGRNIEQRDLMHDVHHNLEDLHSNGIHAVTLSVPDFEPHLKQNEVTFVNFFAPWCIWCQRLEPVWEAFAERVDDEDLPVSIVKVDCVASPELCMNQKIQAFPSLRLFKGTVAQTPDFRADRTVDALMQFLEDRLALHKRVEGMDEHQLKAHMDELEENKDDHPGCLLSGFLLVNRVPGNFHIEARSKHHNLNPKMANLSHVVNSLTFGPVLLPKTARKLGDLLHSLIRCFFSLTLYSLHLLQR